MTSTADARRSPFPPTEGDASASIEAPSVTGGTRSPGPGTSAPAPAPVSAVPRGALRAARRTDEATLVASLLDEARLDPARERVASATARRLVERLRARGARGPVEGVMREYGLSSPEGLALMRLAEALLRTPDEATRDRLIAEAIAGGAWDRHLGRDRPAAVNAATALLLATGRLQRARAGASVVEAGFRLGGEAAIRVAVGRLIRVMGGQFVLGETIEAALREARGAARRGFRHSYDMLGEGAVTAQDAAGFLGDYARAITAIGAAGRARAPADRPGISVKLSALHPRFTEDQHARAMAELLPRVAGLVRAAGRHGIGITIDAEEADRLELTLDIFEALCRDPSLRGATSLGFVVQAYGKRARATIDHLASLAAATGRRIPVRLVKGAYWDGEIKRAQEAGLDDFPVFTRKAHTDVSYIACARAMLDAGDLLYPQFATHNARTVATLDALAGADRARDAFEFQCLHGMGEALYAAVIGPAGLDRPCRIYAPVGTHETLLPYLVRRLLENGANTSFVNQIADPSVDPASLAADPCDRVAAEPSPGAPHPAIRLPPDLYAPSRRNARGHDRADAPTRAWLARAAKGAMPPPPAAPVTDPVAGARAGLPGWSARPAAARAAILRDAADRIEAATGTLLGLVVAEGGRTIPNAVAEIRELVDFCRFYAHEAEALAAATPLGTVLCISPWNFPAAIFGGQVAAALAAGNTVVAKPAPETPRVADAVIRCFHDAGVPEDALVLAAGDGALSARLVASDGVDGVLFTGSTATARRIAGVLAGRPGADGLPPRFVAETGGQNAMVADSSALAEQVVADVMASAFDSAGQRCSALRVLLLADDVAEALLGRLRGAMAELALGDPARFETDVGPVITVDAARRIEAHIARMAACGLPVHRGGRLPGAVPPAFAGRLVRPAIVELDRLDRLEGEVFGPVLHVLRYADEALDAHLAQLRATGYALTFGVHTRLEGTVARVAAGQSAGNLYVNRNMIGAVVGVQPFGGHGLSGTGPKAGGPLTLRRLVRGDPGPDPLLAGEPPPRARALLAALRVARHPFAAAAGAIVAATPLGASLALPGPVGESNHYALAPRGPVLCTAAAAILATGNTPCPIGPFPLPEAARHFAPPVADDGRAEVATVEGDPDTVARLARALADREGRLVTLFAHGETEAPPLAFLCREHHVSTNTAAAGGNATLMAIG